jgi:hypothetical protein
VPQQASSYGWVPLARGCGEELAGLLAYRRALVKAVVVRWIVVFGAGSTKLLSMSGTAACWHVNCEVRHAQRSDDGPWEEAQ